jgi:hypothetical protein
MWVYEGIGNPLMIVSCKTQMFRIRISKAEVRLQI